MDEKAKSFSVIIEMIKSQFQLLKDKDEVENFWFRGEKDFIHKTGESLLELTKNPTAYTPLLPNAYRICGKVEENDYNFVFQQTKEVESNLKVEFSRKSAMFLNQNRINDNDWNQYFLMQHYGLRTRLMDWSESALVAIYFAVENDSNNNDSRIWILNPYRLNKSSTKLIEGFENGCSIIYFPKSSKKHDLFNIDGKLDLDELYRKYLEMDFDANEKAFPLAVYPYLFDERMKSQKACFTIFGNQINGLLNNPENKNFLGSILIDGNHKTKIKEELRWLGISNESVYPGLDSSCKDIQEKYQHNFLMKL